MELEIELKLLTSGEVGPLIDALVLPKLEANVKQQTLILSNSYFDTLSNDFRKKRMGLRIRGCQDRFEQTIKTAGTGLAGLQQRLEYNVQLGSILVDGQIKPDLSLFPRDIWPQDFDVTQAQATLLCQFSTQFTRKVYLLEFINGAQIELVWDNGNVIAGDHIAPINELELELKKGKVADIFDLARKVCACIPTKIGLLSKAARGYQLMESQVASPKKMTVIPFDLVSEDKQAALLSSLTHHLKVWQRMTLALENTGTEIISVTATELFSALTQTLACLAQQDTRLLGLLDELETFSANIKYFTHLDAASTPANLSIKESKAQEFRQRLASSEAIILQLNLMEYLSNIAG